MSLVKKKDEKKWQRLRMSSGRLSKRWLWPCGERGGTRAARKRAVTVTGRLAKNAACKGMSIPHPIMKDITESFSMVPSSRHFMSVAEMSSPFGCNGDVMVAFRGVEAVESGGAGSG